MNYLHNSPNNPVDAVLLQLAKQNNVIFFILSYFLFYSFIFILFIFHFILLFYCILNVQMLFCQLAEQKSFFIYLLILFYFFLVFIFLYFGCLIAALSTNWTKKFFKYIFWFDLILLCFILLSLVNIYFIHVMFFIALVDYNNPDINKQYTHIYSNYIAFKPKIYSNKLISNKWENVALATSWNKKFYILFYFILFHFLFIFHHIA